MPCLQVERVLTPTGALSGADSIELAMSGGLKLGFSGFERRDEAFRLLQQAHAQARDRSSRGQLSLSSL